MTEGDLVGPLQAAIARADPSWVSQPSHLRRRLEEELGPDARGYRAQIHQLIVAAEERVPIRLKRNGWSPTERDELVNLLIGTRGWTGAASEWTVATWAAALGLSDERPVVPPLTARQRSGPNPSPTSDDGGATPGRAPFGPTQQPSDFVVPATEVPSANVYATAVPMSTELPPPSMTSSGLRIDATDPPGDGLRSAEQTVDKSPLDDPLSEGDRNESDPSLAVPAPGGRVPIARAVPSAELPRRGMRGCTKKAAAYLERELDVAYEVKGGPTPALLFLTLPIGLAAFVLPALSGLLLMGFILAIFFLRALWPSRLLAISGDHIWLLSASRLRIKPKALLAEGRREQIDFARGWPFPSVRFAGHRLWFLFPVRGAARRVPTTTTASELRP